MKTPETVRLLLAPWREEDAAALYSLASDPEIGHICGWEPHKNAEESRKVIRDIFSAPEIRAILSRESGGPVRHHRVSAAGGNVPGAASHPTAGGGLWLGRAYWGHGIMPEAVQETLRFGFTDLKPDAVWCSCYDWNRRSRRGIEKRGFRYRLTKKTADIMGTANDTVFYALKRAEWAGESV